MPSVESQIRERVQQFVDELTGLVRSAAMEAVGAALGTGAGTVAPGRRGPKPGRKKAGRAGGSRAVESSSVLSAIRSTPGQRVDEIAMGLGTNSAAVKPAVAELLADGSIRKTGQKRGTRYFVKGAGGSDGAATKSGPRKRKGARRKKASRKTSSRAGAGA